ncbi:hypothetical protein EVAR_89995_1 [Eumeta japonica]|uniref:PiggyBac transposable element-derived protein 4 C-terminal zinc-finger domain-containing protein n=1 Tax=Eumeta variegata TaxID=151549 RepID=A0A4C2A976_EUMVA|nr:hypothetical protein EVAR_89995_1 [Eumeta japonica]
MENEAGPSRPKRPHQLVLGTEIEDLLLEEHDTDDDFIYESSSDDDDDDDDDDHSQPPTLQLPTHRRVSPVCEIESPSHQDFEETGPPSSSSDQLLSFYPCERKTVRWITEKNSNGRIKQKHCRQCYKQKKRSDTTWHCVACNDKPGLCVECFDLYHEEL